MYKRQSLRAAVKEYFEDKAACERRHGKMNTWDVGRVTDMSELFMDRRDFNEARAGVPSSRRASKSVDSDASGLLDACVEESTKTRSTAFVGHRFLGHVVCDDNAGNFLGLRELHGQGHWRVGHVVGNGYGADVLRLPCI